MDISEEKEVIIKAINEKRNVFVTGGAGTGKSYLLNHLKETVHDLHITASTGIAAVNVGGVTLHSWAGLGLGEKSAPELYKKIKGYYKVADKLSNAKRLAIDEISMLPAGIFEKLDYILKKLRNSQLPFGGLQLILFGDFFQLPPVYKDGKPEIEFCFETKAWREANFKCFKLKEVFRQNDLRFIELLENIRYGKVNKNDEAILSMRDISVANNCEDIKPTKISTHNWKVDKINSDELKKIKNKERSYQATEKGDQYKIEFLRRNCLAPSNLKLKKGAQVMMLRNTFQDQGIVNGSTGKITGYNSQGLPIVKFSNGKKMVIETESWKMEVYENGSTKVVAEIIQIPLRLAWAITIHKSQGMTLDCIECDIEDAFADGQIYVALSRVKTLEGLYIHGFDADKIKINKKVIDFMNGKDMCHDKQQKLL